MKRHHIEDLYNELFGGRDRLFCACGNQVIAADDGGGFIVCEIDYADQEIAVLIAELLNEARDMAVKKRKSVRSGE